MRPSPSDAAHCSRASTYSVQAHRQWSNCGRAPYEACHSDRAASPPRNIWAYRVNWLRRAPDRSSTARATSFRFCGGQTLVREWDQLLQCSHVAEIVTRFVNRRFEDKRLVPQPRMTENSAKAFLSNITSTDMGMTVKVRPEGRLCIVGVDHRHMIQAQGIV